jgi:hypothetical protein
MEEEEENTYPETILYELLCCGEWVDEREAFFKLLFQLRNPKLFNFMVNLGTSFTSPSERSGTWIVVLFKSLEFIKETSTICCRINQMVSFFGFFLK